MAVPGRKAWTEPGLQAVWHYYLCLAVWAAGRTVRHKPSPHASLTRFPCMPVMMALSAKKRLVSTKGGLSAQQARGINFQQYFLDLL
jgi:hypothetical protein